MATVNIDSKLLEALQESTCFGIAHDNDTPECKQCDVKGQCKIKTEGGLNIPTPTAKPKETAKPADKPKATTPKAPTKPKATPAKTTAQKQASPAKPKAQTSKPASAPSGNMPDFKPMTLEELKSLAAERTVDWKDYGNDQITRMRLIMALKKSY